MEVAPEALTCKEEVMIKAGKAGLVLGITAVFILTGCAGHKPKVTATPQEQELALQGSDIPLSTISEGMSFSEPVPEDALILKDIHFDFDKSDIKDNEMPIIDGISSWFLNHPQAQLQIEGHCDERGTKEYNLALGERRALSVRTTLTGLGINPELLHTISYGEEKPLCTESTEECWARNRRAHFLVDYGKNSGGGSAPPAPAEVREEIEETTVVEEAVPVPEENPAPSQSREHSRSIDRYRY